MNMIKEIEALCLSNNVIFEVLNNVTAECKTFVTSLDDIEQNISKVKSLKLLSVEPYNSTMLSVYNNFILRCEIIYEK